MSLLLAPGMIAARRAMAEGPLAPLAASLRLDLAPLIAAPPVVPREKARLSRAGGSCPRDGARLAFDPWSPHEHRCPRCGGIERSDAHHRAWLMWHQLWLAERAVHGALLHLLQGRPEDRALSTGILEQYAALYLAFPNRDNVLGPSRVFFSTYLESIWLLQVCLALDLLEQSDAAGALAGTVRDRVIVPAARLIAEFDEGSSNRQVWNDAALMAAGRLLGDEVLVREAALGRSGVVSHLATGLLEDGSWFEGENYHVFAHRGLWYGVTMAEAAGIELSSALVRRFDEGFVTPWLTALPDMTMPSRRDSPYAVSLRQWRFAEMAELGFARTGDARLGGALAALYESDIPRRDTGRSRSAADVERNEPPTCLTRAELGWRALLHALPSLGELPAIPLRSALLRGQGFGVLRGDGGRLYASLDYGHSGGGHGHPDRLGVILCDGDTRVLDDPGTGSYVDRSLHWYRSTLAHNAPLVDGRSQERVHGRLVAFDERADCGWIVAAADGIAPGVSATRSLVAMSDYVLDTFEWTSTREVRMELPMHVAGVVPGARWTSTVLSGAGGLEDGFDFVNDAERAVAVREAGGAASSLAATTHTNAHAADAHASFHSSLTLIAGDGNPAPLAYIFAEPSVELFRARTPGPPGSGDRMFHLARWIGTSGRLTTVWDPRRVFLRCIMEDGRLVVHRADGSSHEHARTPAGWRVVVRGDHPHELMLGGVEPDAEPGARPPRAVVNGSPRQPHRVRRTPIIFELGEAHYRRSELTWHDAGEPRALIAVSRDDTNLIVGVRVLVAEPTFIPTGAVNAMDNEHPDINGHGVQLHLRAAGAAPFTAGWVIIPDAGERLRVREIAGSEAGWLPSGGWQRMPDGYRLLVLVPLDRLGPGPTRAVTLDVLINETSPDRERRRGQLVLSGARGEWVFLRGDRQPAERFLPFIIEDA